MLKTFLMPALGAGLLVMPTMGHAEEAPICTDRPAKANAVCTVPAGEFQLETTGASWSLTRAGGTRTELLTLGASVLKLGLSERSDLQFGFVPFAQATTRQAGSRTRVSGVGDVTIRYKRQLTAIDARVKVAAIPFVKLPTAAQSLGNGKVEGGVAVPVSLPLAGSATLTLGPELDLLADTDGSGRHFGIVNLVNLSAPVAPRITVAGELWSSLNFDPSGTIKQASFDTAVAYAATRRLQLDMGANVGLTRDTPDIELYAGASILF